MGSDLPKVTKVCLGSKTLAGPLLEVMAIAPTHERRKLRLREGV